MRILSNILLVATVALAGCDSMSERVHERFSAVAPKTRVYAYDEATVRAAVIFAFRRLDFAVSASTDSGGGIEASGQIRRSEAMGDSRQLIANVHLQEVGLAQTEVGLLLTEQVADSSTGGSSEQALREHGLYSTFFETLQQILTDQSRPEAPGTGG